MNYKFLLLFSALFGYYQQTETETVELTIVVTNIHTLEGHLKMGIFKDSGTFLQKGKEYKAYSIKPKGKTTIIHVRGIKKGDYAISIYHDINDDSNCNLSWIFRPIEPYGFSNNVKLVLFKPSFNDCKFNADRDREITIRLTDV